MTLVLDDLTQPGAPITGTDLGLYSVTFVNDIDADVCSLEAFAEFRRDAAANGFKYFYEVFNPNIPTTLDREQTGQFVNDCILRSLAGVSLEDRPQFLKIVYNGPEALEELASFDPSLIVGVLGGSAGTTAPKGGVTTTNSRPTGRNHTPAWKKSRSAPKCTATLPGGSAATR